MSYLLLLLFQHKIDNWPFSSVSLESNKKKKKVEIRKKIKKHKRTIYLFKNLFPFGSGLRAVFVHGGN